MTTLESRLEDYRQQIERLENAVARKDRQIDGAPQRCPQCLAAEVKAEVPNGRAV
jgi:hypothetical protein